MKTIYDLLENNSYPGRGIFVGRTPCGRKMRVAYWIMGRSENSRNRIFAETEDGIETRAFDESKMRDPSLIIYHPVRRIKEGLIVTNGDQTDTIKNGMEEGKSFFEALRTRTFEPDSPNYTPRISALIHGASLDMAILKSKDHDSTCVLRQLFEYRDLNPQDAYVLTTYEGDGNPLPSFEGEPKALEVVHEKFDVFTQHVWNALDSENKVSLYTAQITIETGETESMIINKNQ